MSFQQKIAYLLITISLKTYAFKIHLYILNIRIYKIKSVLFLTNKPYNAVPNYQALEFL